jgi:hypothetical protein
MSTQRKPKPLRGCVTVFGVTSRLLTRAVLNDDLVPARFRYAGRSESNLFTASDYTLTAIAGYAIIAA